MTAAQVWKLGEAVKAIAAGVAAACAPKDESERKPSCACCEVPETACPPRCVGTIAWKIARGAIPEATVRVRNDGNAARNFSFAATELAGPGAGSAALQVAPASAMLQPGESAVVRVKLADSLSLRACQSYRAEILITGAWQQCVAVVCAVQPDPFDRVTVEQDDSGKDKGSGARTWKTAVEWKIERGVEPEAAVTLHNTGRASQSFGFEASPLVGPDAAGAALGVSPDSLLLAPGQTAVVKLRLQGSLALAPGQTYEAALVIRGFFEQRLAIRTWVEPDDAGHVEVAQGEAPTRKRAHHWYDHFQCTDACTPR